MIKRYIKIPQNNSVLLLGPRQCGKSTLVDSFLSSAWKINLLLSEQYFKYLQHPELFRLEAEQKIKEGIRNFFIDEVQRVPELLNEVQFLMDHHPDCRFILTGSSARKLKRGSANLLAGRAILKKLFPFIYTEIADSFQLDKILRFGSLPAIFNKSEELKMDILNSYTEIYLKEEIQAEGIARKISAFVRFLEIAASQFTEVLNYSNIARDVGISSNTVQNHYDILEDTLIGFRLPGWGKSTRKQMLTSPKFYFFDNGVTNSINHLLKEGPPLALRGKLFEQWILNEVRTLISYEKSDVQISYWRTNSQMEVDLLLSKRGQITAAIEIKYVATPLKTHISGLHSFASEHPNIPTFVVSLADEPYAIGPHQVLSWKTFLTHTLKTYL